MGVYHPETTNGSFLQKACNNTCLSLVTWPDEEQNTERLGRMLLKLIPGEIL